MAELPELSAEELARYEWQMWIADFGAAAQRRLKGAAVLVSRIGGVGGMVAYQLAAAGVGKLVLAHAGDIKPADLNRQLLMTHEGVGTSRVRSAERRLKELNPLVEIVVVNENITEDNAARLVSTVDMVVDCAPLFSERFLMNREAVRQGKPMVDCAMYAFEGQLTTIVPGATACLACLFPEPPEYWKRQFPVLGAVAGTMGGLAAVEAIKVLTGIGESLAGVLLTCDFRSMTFLRTGIKRNPRCPICGSS